MRLARKLASAALWRQQPAPSPLGQPAHVRLASRGALARDAIINGPSTSKVRARRSFRRLSSRRPVVGQCLPPPQVYSEPQPSAIESEPRAGSLSLLDCGFPPEAGPHDLLHHARSCRHQTVPTTVRTQTPCAKQKRCPCGRRERGCAPPPPPPPPSDGFTPSRPRALTLCRPNPLITPPPSSSDPQPQTCERRRARPPGKLGNCGGSERKGKRQSSASPVFAPSRPTSPGPDPASARIDSGLG